MKKSKEQAALYIAKIRKLMVVQHDMPLREIQMQLEENGTHLHLNYIAKLRNKILAERAVRANRATLNRALAAFEDALTEATRQAWLILMSARSTNREKLSAIAQIRENSKVLFDKLLDAGVFERRIGTLNVESHDPYTEEVISDIVATIRRYGAATTEISAQDAALGQPSTNNPEDNTAGGL